VYAGHFYNVPTGEEAIYTVTAKADDTFQTFNTLTNANTAVDLLTSDLNGDGSGDLISINNPATSGSATVTVFLGKADGSFPTPTEITLAGNTAVSAVIDDFNGDGKKDLVVATDGTLQTGGDPSSIGPVQAFYIGSGGRRNRPRPQWRWEAGYSHRLRGTLESAWWRGDHRLDHRPHCQRTLHLCGAKRNLYCYRSGALRQHNRAYRQCVLL
jgi:hypothetical protein